MAGMGRKVWTRETLGVDELQNYLQDQAVMFYASAAARTAEIPAPTEGMVTYLSNVDRLEVCTADGGPWEPVGSKFRGSGTDLPTAYLASGDTYFHTGLRCLMIYQATSYDGYEWRQVNHSTLVANEPTYLSGNSTLEPLLHPGFQAWQADAKVMWEWDGDTWRNSGGYWGSGISLPTSDLLRSGDTYFHTGLRCLMAYQAATYDGTTMNWRQATTSVVNAGLPSAISDAYPALVHPGFRCFRVADGATYEWNGSAWGYSNSRALAVHGTSFQVFGGVPWALQSGVTRDHGAGMGYGTYTFQRITSSLTPNASGTLTTESAPGKVPVGFEPLNAMALSSRTGRGVQGRLDSDGTLTLTSLSGSAALAIGDTVNLTGTWRLAAFV